MRKAFQLFMPPELHKETKLKAIKYGKSMNQYMIDCIQFPPARCACADHKDNVTLDEVIKRNEYKEPEETMKNASKFCADSYAKKGEPIDPEQRRLHRAKKKLKIPTKKNLSDHKANCPCAICKKKKK